MILYTSGASFFLSLILCSIAWLPPSILCLILGIQDLRWEVILISIAFFLGYFLSVFIFFKDMKNKKYFLEVTEKIIIESPWLQGKIELVPSDLKYLEFTKASSITNWLSAQFGVLPHSVFVVYMDGGIEKSLNIGSAKLKEVEKFCDEANIKLIIS